MLSKSIKEVNKIADHLSEIRGCYESSYIEVMGKVIQREMGIFRILSHFTTEDSYYKAMLWSPVSSEDAIEAKINDINENLTYKVSRRKRHFQFQPPTSIVKNKFLDVFQKIVNIYGTPRYREINPAIFTSITLPMQFGVMFGDVGHGKKSTKIKSNLLILGLIFLIVGYLLFFKPELFKKIGLSGALQAKWLVLLMGVFSVYSGLIYNEFMSMKFPFFQTCFPKLKQSKGCVYPVGFDWMWAKAGNMETFYNSYRTKLSVIIGFCHITLGIVLKGMSDFFNGNTTEIVLDFIPKMVFFCGVFGYLVFLIVFKWLHSWGSSPPSLLSVMINLYKKPTPVNQVFGNLEQQHSLQISLLSKLESLEARLISLTSDPLFQFKLFYFDLIELRHCLFLLTSHASCETNHRPHEENQQKSEC